MSRNQYIVWCNEGISTIGAFRFASPFIWQDPNHWKEWNLPINQPPSSSHSHAQLTYYVTLALTRVET